MSDYKTAGNQPAKSGEVLKEPVDAPNNKIEQEMYVQPLILEDVKKEATGSPNHNIVH